MPDVERGMMEEAFHLFTICAKVGLFHGIIKNNCGRFSTGKMLIKIF
jgi:hypothetical protein